MNAEAWRTTSRTWLKRQKGRQAGEVYLSLQKDAEVIKTIDTSSRGMEQDRFGIRDEHCWLAFAQWHVIPVSPRDSQRKRKRMGYAHVSWENMYLFGKYVLWIRRVYTLVKEKYSSAYQASSHKAFDTGHSWRKYNVLSQIQDGENRSWLYAFREGQVGSPKGQQDIKLRREWQDAGMARNPSYLVNSDLNSELKENKNCRGFNDSLKSMFVRHKRCEIPAVSRGWDHEGGLVNYIWF